MGLYSVNKVIYNNLRHVCGYIETLSTTQSNPRFEDKIMSDIYSQLKMHVNFSTIIAMIDQHFKQHNYGIVELFDDHLISKLVERLLV